MAVVPSLVFQLLAHPKLRSKDTDLSSLINIGSGAAYLPPAVSLHPDERSGFGLTDLGRTT